MREASIRDLVEVIEMVKQANVWLILHSHTKEEGKNEIFVELNIWRSNIGLNLRIKLITLTLFLTKIIS